MRALKAGNSAQILALNQRFHFTIYAIARSWVLMPMIEALWLRAGPFMHLAQSSPGVNWDGRHHAELVRALGRRDARGGAARHRARHQHGGPEPAQDAAAARLSGRGRAVDPPVDNPPRYFSAATPALAIFSSSCDCTPDTPIAPTHSPW